MINNIAAPLSRCSSLDKSSQTNKTEFQMLSAEELKCAICVTVISSRANLTTHMVLKHAEGEKSNYNCSSCDKGFIRLCDLNNHKQGHKGSLGKLNKQFKCKICSRSFVSIKNFERHQEIHTIGLPILWVSNI